MKELLYPCLYCGNVVVSEDAIAQRYYWCHESCKRKWEKSPRAKERLRQWEWLLFDIPTCSQFDIFTIPQTLQQKAAVAYVLQLQKNNTDAVQRLRTIQKAKGVTISIYNNHSKQRRKNIKEKEEMRRALQVSKISR